MATGVMGNLLQYLRGRVGRGWTADHSDGQLLERFVVHRDAAAFETLLQRHATLVWHVCRRILELKPFNITSVEQPLPHAQLEALAQVRRQVGG